MGAGVAGDVVGDAPGLQPGQVKVVCEVHQEQHRRAFPAEVVRERGIQKHDGGMVAFQLPARAPASAAMDGETGRENGLPVAANRSASGIATTAMRGAERLSAGA